MPMINCPYCGQLNHNDDRSYCKQCGGRLDAPGQTLAPVTEHQHSDGQTLKPWWQNPANRGTVFAMVTIPLVWAIFFAVMLFPSLWRSVYPEHAEAERACIGYTLGFDASGDTVCGDLILGNSSGLSVDYFDYCQSLGYDGGRWPFCLEKLEE